MFLTDQSMLTDTQPGKDSIKLNIYSEDGQICSLNAPLDMQLENLKTSAIDHFNSGHPVASFLSSSEEADPTLISRKYFFLLARCYRILDDNLSLGSESLQDNDELILILRSGSNPLSQILPESAGVRGSDAGPDDFFPTADQINKETAFLRPKFTNKPTATLSNNASDFKIALRQILSTMIETSISIIATENDADQLFNVVFEHLEKRHKPRVDKMSLKQLTEMGFSKAKATKALQLKRTTIEAMEWLLQESKGPDCEEEAVEAPAWTPGRVDSSSSEDTTAKVLKVFQQYVDKWFVPDPRALFNLVSLGYGEDLAKEALKVSCNSEKHAMEFLEGRPALAGMNWGFDRDSPIMVAILDSPIVQVALSKPKTLFALMVLYETPNNVNVWLSDPETHPVVSQVLRIYHAEKHRLTSNDSSSGHPETGNPNLESHSHSLEAIPNDPGSAISSDPGTMSDNFDPANLSVSYDPGTIADNFDPANLSVSYDPGTIADNFDPANLSVSYDPDSSTSNLNIGVPNQVRELDGSSNYQTHSMIGIEDDFDSNGGSLASRTNFLEVPEMGEMQIEISTSPPDDVIDADLNSP